MRGQVALVGELVPYAAAGATGGASPSSAPAPTSYTFLDFGVAPGTIADAAFEHRVIVEAQLEL